MAARVRSVAARTFERQQGRALPSVLDALPDDVGALSWSERLDVLDAWAQVLDGLYVHLPLKRALYGFDALRAIEHLRLQVPQLSHLEFHRELTQLVNRLRDAHTQYSGPKRLTNAVATLPFLIESWGPRDACRFVVSKVSAPQLVRDRYFERGVTLSWWNGVPFGRAVDLHADVETGGRPDARRARALVSMTFRALEYGPPPDEHWVTIGYTDLANREREVRLNWQVVVPDRAPSAAQNGAEARTRRGIDSAAESIRRAKKLLFKPQLWRRERQAGRRATSLREEFQDFLTARTVRTQSGRFGYLRIWSFDVNNDQRFVQAAIALLNDLPDSGVIIDLRDNPGGFIWAAERLLQLFTPSQVVPTKFAFRVTPLTVAMATARMNQDEFGPWAESLATAAITGEPYSAHLPITSLEQCNDIGQQYGGPVVIVVDANTYSSGDLFAAGIADNRIGTVVCVGEATGAGGANVWSSEDVDSAMRAAGVVLPALARGVNFTVSMRRAVRNGPADGALIEDGGVAGQPYTMTERDLLSRNRDLMEHCGRILAAQPLTRMKVTRRAGWLAVHTTGLDHVDVFIDGHPLGRGTRVSGHSTVRLKLPGRVKSDIEVVGFGDGVIKQRRRLQVG